MNITDSMFALKQFLKYRDTRDEFARIKENGNVGIPCIVVDHNQFYFEDELDEFMESMK